jgi:anthranilate phosphoribosyltransferase
MIKDALRKITFRENLTRDEASGVMTQIMEGGATPVQIGALLASMRVKGESVDELVGFATVMREKSVKVPTAKRPLLDTCGTGGDVCDTFNISTTAAFVIAGCGIAVAKHGNRAVSSKCGAADVLAALGVDMSLTPEQIGKCIDTVGVGFMYAPSHHPATKAASGPRSEMGIRTVFNILGPLSNPAGATRQLVGVFHPDLCSVVAETLGELGCDKAFVVHGMDGLDEISNIGPTRMSQLLNGRVHTDTRIPSEFHVVPARLDQIEGADTQEGNAEILRAVLNGEHGPRRDVVCINACAGLILAGIAEGWRDGLSLAARCIDNGKANAVLDRLIDFTQKCAQGKAG